MEVDLEIGGGKSPREIWESQRICRFLGPGRPCPADTASQCRIQAIHEGDSGSSIKKQFSGQCGISIIDDDSVSAVKTSGLADKMSHIFTSDATLEYLESKELPGVATLTDKDVHARRTKHRGGEIPAPFFRFPGRSYGRLPEV